MKIPDIANMPGVNLSEQRISANYPEFYKMISERWPDLTFGERLQWYLEGLTEKPVCKCCGAPVAFEGVRKGYRKYCSRKCMNSDPDKKAAVRSTNIKKYGGPAPCSSKEIFAKMEATLMQRYGHRNALQIPEIKDRVFSTITNRYGGVGAASPELREKQRQTLIERYGVEYSHQCPEIMKKAMETIKEKYGVSDPRSLGADKLRDMKLKQSQEHYPDIIEAVGDCWVCACSNPDCGLCQEKTYITPKNVHRDRFRQGTVLCTKMLPVGDPSRTSTQELTIQSWLDEWGIEYEIGNRTIIAPKELDIYIPSLSVAIECNGCYWHSDMEKPRTYHIDKFKQCRDRGVHLIQIWEDWMINRPDVVKSFLQAKLHCCTNTIYARKCEVREVEYHAAMSFLSENHIQGRCSSNYRAGLYHNDVLVAIMCFNKRSALSGPKSISESEAELIRFCNARNMRVIGGAGKLLNHYIEKFHPTIVTSYSANDISDGGLYKALGFESDLKVSESYWYIEPGTYKRQHRSIYTRSGISKKWPEYDISDKSWTERSVMDSKGYMRIYDAGTTRWTKKVV